MTNYGVDTVVRDHVPQGHQVLEGSRKLPFTASTRYTGRHLQDALRDDAHVPGRARSGTVREDADVARTQRCERTTLSFTREGGEGREQSRRPGNTLLKHG